MVNMLKKDTAVETQYIGSPCVYKYTIFELFLRKAIFFLYKGGYL